MNVGDIDKKFLVFVDIHLIHLKVSSNELSQASLLRTTGPHMSCSYSDIGKAHFDNRAENYTLKPTVWKPFRDGVFSVWTHNINILSAFPDYLNNIDSTGKINLPCKLQMKIALSF